MGTSSSQRSPDTASWRAVLATYRQSLPVGRVVEEVWRAAAGDRDAGWVDGLSSPAVFACYQIAGEALDAPQAVRSAGRLIASEHESSIASELGKLALAKAAGRPQSQGRFVTSLFEQATDYMVSRDLAGFVGSRYRNTTVDEALAFKRAVAGEVREQIGRSPERLSRQQWRQTVSGIVADLSRRQHR